MKTLKIWSWWLAGVCLLVTGMDVQAVNLYLRSGSAACTFSGSTTQTLQLKSGTAQTGIAFSAQTNLFSFYSAPLTNSVFIAAGKKTSGTIGVQNNGSADFQFSAKAVYYDYDPATGNQVQMVATATSALATASKNGKSGHVTLPVTRLGGAGHTIPSGHLVKTVITVTVNLSSGISGALIYNAASGNGKTLVQFPQDNSVIWPFGSFPTTPNASITTPASTQENSTGNVATVLNAGMGATYFWSITNGTITAGQSTPQITWTAGASGTAGLGITIVNGCFSANGAAVVTLNAKTNQTVSFNPIPTQTYGNSPITLVASASSGLPVTFNIVSGPATMSGSTLTITDAGTIVVNANQAGNSSYNPAVVEQSFTVNPATLSVSGITANDKVYDSTTTAVLNTNGAVLVGLLPGDNVALDFTFAAGYFADGNVDSGKTVQISGLDITGTDAGNYTLVAPTTTASITAAPLTITAVADSKTYDGTMTSSATPTVAGLQGSDTVTGLVQAFDTPNAGTGKTLNVTSYFVNDGNNGANYAVGTGSSSAGVINAASLTVIAAANTKSYDGSTSATATPTVSGLQGSDSVTGLAEIYDTRNVGSGKTLIVSAYTVIDGNNGANYTVGTVSSSAGVINAASLTVTAAANTKSYDGSTSAAATPTISGLQGSDSVTGLAETYDTRNVGSGKTLTVSAYTVNDGNSGNNYSVSTVTSSAGVINPAILTVTANNQLKMCGQPNPVLTASYSGFINGDNVSVLTTTATLSTPATTGSVPGSYPITASSASAVNYTMNYVDGTLVVAQPFQLSCARVTVSGTTQFVVSWPTLTGHNYQLEYISNLATPTWTPVGSPLPGTGSTVAVTNDMSGSTQGFFRVQEQ